MKHPARIALILFAGLCALPRILCAAGQAEFHGVISRLPDADTYIVDKADGTQVKIRLHYGDAPEKKQTGGKEAIEFANKWLLNAKVTVKPISKSYDRIVGDVTWNLGKPPWNPGEELNVDVAWMLVANGWAMCDPKFRPPQTLLEAEGQAMVNNRGIHAPYSTAEPPWQYRKRIKDEKGGGEVSDAPNTHSEEYDGWDITVVLGSLPRKAVATKTHTQTIEKKGQSYDEAIQNVKDEIDKMRVWGS